MLGGQLGGGRDLDHVGLPQAALGEGAEPPQRLDLDVEQLDADRALLGRREEVDDAAPHRELAAVLDLLDALVAGGHQVVGQLVEVQQVALGDLQPVGAQRRVRTFSDRATALTITTGALLSSSSASRAATRRPIRCGGGVRWDS